VAGQTALLNLTVLANDAGDFTNTVNIISLSEEDFNLTNNSSSANITVIEIDEPVEIDLSISKSVNSEIVDLSDKVTFSIVVLNNSNHTANNIIVEELLPAGLDYINHTISVGMFDPNSKLWTIPVLSGQSSARLDLELQANTLGTMVNIASIISSTETDNNLFNDRASAAVLVTEKTLFADLSLTNSTNKPIADVGESVEFTIILSNYGPNDANNIVVEEILPNTINYLSHVETSGVYSTSNGLWTIDNLPANTSVALSIQTNSSIIGEHTNIATIISSDALDSNISNNIASAVFTVLATVIDPCLSPTICATINKCTEPGMELLICPDFCAEGDFAITAHSNLLPGNSTIILDNCINYTASALSNNINDIVKIEAVNENDVCLNFNANIEIRNCNQINRAPVISNSNEAFCGAPVRSTTICIEASDPNNNDISICEISTLFDCSLGNADEMCFTYKALPGSTGTDEVTVTVCDNGNPSLSSSATYYVNIACTTPTLSNDYLSVNNTGITFNSNTFDYNNSVAIVNPLLNDFVSAGCYNNLTISSVSTIANATGEVMLVDGQIQFKPNPTFTGSDVINYRACNNCGRCETGNIYVEGEMQNCELFSEICSPAFAAIEICVEFCSSDTEIQNINSLYNAGTSAISERCFTYNENGLTGITDTLQITGKDVSGNIETVQILNYINDDCLKPLAVDDVLNTIEHKAVIFDVVKNDDPITNNYTLKIIEQTKNGKSVKNLNGSILYKPDYGFKGRDVLTYQLCNAHYNCDTAKVYLSVEDDNLPNLIAFNDYFVTDENKAITIDVMANDTMMLNTNTVISVIATPLFGAITITGNDIAYSPSQNFTGEDFFEYELCNEYNECDKAIVQISVSEIFITDTDEFILPQSFEILQLLNNSNTISLQIKATESNMVDYYLFDVMGRNLQGGELNLLSGENLIHLERPANSSQVLLFSLKSDTHFLTEKIYAY